MSLRENMAEGRSLASGRLWLAVGFPELRSKIRWARRNFYSNLRLGASHIHTPRRDDRGDAQA